MCKLKAFINYGLGFEGKTNLKAEWGTCVHAVLEILAQAKKKHQETNEQEFVIEHKVTGPIKIDTRTWLSPQKLSKPEIDSINTARAYKTIYKYNCLLPENYIRYGQKLVDDITSLCYAYYSNKSEHEWDDASYKFVKNNVWLTLEYQNGLYDPRKRHIVQTEHHFNLELPYDWAKYSYDLPNGTTAEGQLSIKGTIDLVTYDQDLDILEITDYKTGQFRNWATGKDKTIDSLKHDKQLLLYYYVAHKLYPDAKHIMITIFYSRSAGPITPPFESYQVQEIEDFIRRDFEETRNCTQPEMCDPRQKNIKCSKFCDYYKMQVGDTNFCKVINEKLKTEGMASVLQEYMKVDKLGYYESPGE